MSAAGALLEKRPSTPAVTSDDARTKARPWKLLLLGCLAVATLSLLLPSVPTYDPWAWIIWGREILHGDLVTTTGPSWKPLPVLFTTPFSVLGDDGAPLAWLVIARAGGILAFAMAYRLGSRLAGPIAGLIAAAALFLADDFIFNFARGNSEGILVALCLWALERHLDDRPRDAFLLGLGAALLRPEVWLFIALYGLYLIWRERTRGSVILVLASGLGLALLWFVPEYIGSGNVFRAASRALEPVPDSPAQAAHPFVAVFTNSAAALWAPAYVGGVLAVLLALLGDRRDPRNRAVLALAIGSTVLMITVAVLAEIGFTGNLRYVALPASLVCVLAGVGWARAFALVRRRAGAVVAAVAALVVLAAAVPFAVADVNRTRGQFRAALDEAAVADDLPAAIAKAGGPAALERCGRVKTGPFETQLVAWHLHMHQHTIGLLPTPPATVVAVRGSGRPAGAPGFRTVALTKRWVVQTSCAR